MIIDLRSPVGNAYALMAIAAEAARKIGWEEQQINSLIDRMRAGSYIDLLETMEKELAGIFEFKNDPRSGDWEDEEDEDF